MKIRELVLLGFIFVGSVACPASAAKAQGGAQTARPVKVGWIGPMTGGAAKYGAFQAALLAKEDINKAGGINGRPLELIMEDGKGDSKTAVSAAMKLINLDRVKYIVGGHCSPETLPVAPIAERNKVLLLAAITSSPKLTAAGDHVFRLTPVSLALADKVGEYAYDKLGIRSLSIIHEETDYARPVAEHLRDLFIARGGRVHDFVNYPPGETDFRAVLTRIKSHSPQGVFIGAQAPESAALIIQQLRDMGIKAQLFGNESTGHIVSAVGAAPELAEGIIFAEAAFNLNEPITRDFRRRYLEKFRLAELPYGIWTAEAYDAVMLLAKLIAECGDDVDRVKTCLYRVKDYHGASGRVGIDSNGDGVREYHVKQVRDGRTSSP